jgi:hypothetical protein
MAQIASGPLNSPYRRAFVRLPSSIQSSLWDHGYSRIQPDGELLKEFLEIEQAEQQTTSLWTTSLGALILEKCMEYNDLTNEIETPKCPTPEQRPKNIITVLLDHLVAMVPCGKQTDAYSTFEMELAQQDRQGSAQQFALETKKREPYSGNHSTYHGAHIEGAMAGETLIPLHPEAGQDQKYA